MTTQEKNAFIILENLARQSGLPVWHFTPQYTYLFHFRPLPKYKAVWGWYDPKAVQRDNKEQLWNSLTQQREVEL